MTFNPEMIELTPYIKNPENDREHAALEVTIKAILEDDNELHQSMMLFWLEKENLILIHDPLAEKVRDMIDDHFGLKKGSLIEGQTMEGRTVLRNLESIRTRCILDTLFPPAVKPSTP